MHQSISAAPSFPPPPPGYCGAFARVVSPGGGALANFNTHADSYQHNYTEDFSGKNKQIGSFVKDGEELKRFVKACS